MPKQQVFVPTTSPGEAISQLKEFNTRVVLLLQFCKLIQNKVPAELQEMFKGNIEAVDLVLPWW